MNLLEKNITEYKSSKGNAIYKPFHFAPIYEQFLTVRRNTNVVLLEIGVGYGGCLEMWQEYLGTKSMIFGIDKNDAPYLHSLQNDRLKFFVGDQSQREFLNKIPELVHSPDIIIDDGSHMCLDQICTFLALFPHMPSGGIYFCEDTHTSYRPGYGGGYQGLGTFIEFCKKIIDALHCAESDQILDNNPSLRAICSSIESIHFFRSMVVIKKGG